MFVPRKKDLTHVDEFIDNYKGNDYARWMLMHFRLPAYQQAHFNKFIADKELYCTFEGKRLRCVGASAIGDVWLNSDYKKDYGHEYRVCVDDCSDWGDKP